MILWKKINPNHIDKEYKMPRLRTKITAQNDWNAHHRPKIKHHIIDKLCESGKVSVIKHGRYNIINYDELEEELKSVLKEKQEKKKLLKEQEKNKRKRGRPRKNI